MILRTITRNLLRSNRTLGFPKKPINYAVCIDIECTCDSPLQIHPMEVIELACFKLDLTKLNKENRNDPIDDQSIFHHYVKPTVNPNLTFFCQDLTGILQPTVDQSETIDKIVVKLLKWLQDINLVDDNYEKKEEFAFASCGNFDLKLLSPIIRDCQFNKNLELLPIYFKEWINVKKTFVNHKREWPRGLYHMMELLGEEPSGRIHSAMDDCKNLARVVECLHLDGCKFHVTNKLCYNNNININNNNVKPQLELRDL